jgi:predicted hotdog family 3-hydroxylacyl-ACP dehydratase
MADASIPVDDTPVQNIPIDELVPHADTMSLLDGLNAVGDDHVEAALTVRADGLFDDGNGQVPAWLGMEYMAQTVAAWAGFHGRRAGNGIKIGFLLGTRQFRSSIAQLSVGTALTVRARKLLQDDHGMAAFECRIDGIDGATGRAIEQTASLNVFQPDDPHAILTGEL